MFISRDIPAQRESKYRESFLEIRKRRMKFFITSRVCVCVTKLFSYLASLRLVTDFESEKMCFENRFAVRNDRNLFLGICLSAARFDKFNFEIHKTNKHVLHLQLPHRVFAHHKNVYISMREWVSGLYSRVFSHDVIDSFRLSSSWGHMRQHVKWFSKSPLIWFRRLLADFTSCFSLWRPFWLNISSFHSYA